MSAEMVEAFCSKCGATFKMFLDEMAAKNEKVVCPQCAAAADCAAAVPQQRPAAG
jgi:DNA-directed RNA polymerase subunit RPC12/RpoP